MVFKVTLKIARKCLNLQQDYSHGIYPTVGKTWNSTQKKRTENSRNKDHVWLLTNMAIRVQIKVAKGVTEGRTVCWNCWTKPLVIEALGILLGSRSFSSKPTEQIDILFCFDQWHTMCYMASLVAQLVKNPPTMLETWVRSLGWEDPLEKEMATHSSVLAWRIPRTEKSGGLQFLGFQRVGHDWVTDTFTPYFTNQFLEEKNSMLLNLIDCFKVKISLTQSHNILPKMPLVYSVVFCIGTENFAGR